MPATLIDGKQLSFSVRRQVARRVAEARRPVRLDAVIAGDDKGADIYAHNQRKTCAAVGIEYHLHRLPGDVDQAGVVACIERLNESEDVSAIMVHMPLPEGVEAEGIQAMIDQAKDVEGVNPANIGNIVGKPIAVLLMRAEATVISTNKFTEDLPELTRSADVLVSAAGVPSLISADMVKPGAVVVDVGINRVTGADGKRTTVGDVAYDEVAEVAGHLSPVPGGVGPMTVAMLLRNTCEAALG